jgi:NDP-sugar pyrophosphorylase family protein
MDNTKINILIPMAGAGSRFGSNFPPKPFVIINNKPMIELAIKSLSFRDNYNYIFYVRSEMIEDFKKLLFLNDYNYEIIEVKKLTEGCACTCLLGISKINNNNPAIIINCDQIMDWDGQKFIDFCINSNMDGVVVTYNSNSPKNSYVRLCDDGMICETVEKKVISNLSTNGISYWKHGKDFVESCAMMIANNDRCNNEFYIAPSYNYLIQNGKKIINYHIDINQHHAVGTPEDLERYLIYANNKIE